jgi:AraC-like DNA-binding protein
MTPELHTPDAASDYREFRVRPDLSRHFLCFWTQSITGQQNAFIHRVLPDACVDIVLVDDNEAQVVGPWTNSFVVQFPVGTKIVGARLHPGRAVELLGLPASELVNQSVTLAALWGQSQSDSFARVSDASTLTARRLALGDILAARSSRATTSHDPTITTSLYWLARHPHGRIDQLSQSLGISSRQLHRRFAAAVGYSPKMFQSVLRFQRLLHFAGNHAPQSLADLAAHAGYSDQPHMTREVQRFAGCTPTALLPSAGCTLRMSDLFKTAISALN